MYAHISPCHMYSCAYSLCPGCGVPSNISFCLVLQLADFGLSRVLGDLATHVSTRTYGTISFMPPELIRDAKLSKAADVYSYGILMWETYNSRTAYEGVPAATVSPWRVRVRGRVPRLQSQGG